MSPKISTDKKKQQINKIINGAVSAFREKGYEQTTMKDIRESAGVSTGSLYMYFSNKEEIFINILEARISEHDSKSEISENISCFNKIEKFIDNTNTYCRNIQDGIAPIAYEYSISAWREADRKKFLNIRYDMGVNYIKGLIEEGIRLKEFNEDIDVESISNFIITVFEGINTLSVSLGNEKIDATKQLDFLKEILEKKLKIK